MWGGTGCTWGLTFDLAFLKNTTCTVHCPLLHPVRMNHTDAVDGGGIAVVRVARVAMGRRVGDHGSGGIGGDGGSKGHELCF